MLVYRIVHKDYSRGLFASGREGRWNSSGNKVIYSAESVALAFLENMVRRQGVGFNLDFKIMVIDIADNLKIATINAMDLDKGWRSFKNYPPCQALGNQWYEDGTFPVLKVPSAILPEAFNYVINATHTDFLRVRLLQTTDLVPDQRLEEILKNNRR